MKIDVVTLKSKKAVLKIDGAELYLVNSLRRIMLSELPTLAIEDVVIYDNEFPWYYDKHDDTFCPNYGGYLYHAIGFSKSR